jgi:hypothetical protein
MLDAGDRSVALEASSHASSCTGSTASASTRSSSRT